MTGFAGQRTPHNLNSTILREYDIRGIVGDTLTAEDAYVIGRAFGTEISSAGAGVVCVGYDGRLSSPEMECATVDGLTACGLEVVRVGLGPTPMLYFSVNRLNAAGGIMISGSHNPPEYNGFKMMRGAKPFYGADITNLDRIASAGRYASGEGTVRKNPMLGHYVERILQDYRDGRDLRVAWDAGNGAAGEAMVQVTAQLPGEHFLLNEKIDGSFPAHHPDPTVVENMRQLRDVVLVQNCDLGIAFDGDGDRIGVIDSEGEILWGDQLMTIWAEDVLTYNPGATIIADVKASQVLFDRVAEMGGRPMMWRTGHSLIKAKMAETGALLSGEMSGHIFFADRYFGYDDALYAAVRLLGCLANREETLADIRRSLPKMLNTPELRFPCAEDRKLAVVEEVRDRLSKLGANFVDIDGVRVISEDGWWLLRSSNTQDALVARCEAGTLKGLERVKNALVQQIRSSGIEPPDF
ncbi:MAG: Phosphomannomutase/phosphoglucomutase [Alphaproteobacteria bacterium MarineAlpha11_Bin1]|nr:MAG: Phosphomannomutase/phosphoglucomutase [Alphaproteobacteria bacterium MarineAlpha11_Bin1]|tara:strand:- start:42 stop:1442 length:1401 start_codon:yes stop_codon:yes gene_type:complete